MAGCWERIVVDRGGGTWAYRFGAEQLSAHGPGVEPHPVARNPVAPGNSDRAADLAALRAVLDATG